jgi:hypothetical protein
MDMKEKRTTSAAQQGWWVQPGSHSRWAEAGEQAGQKQSDGGSEGGDDGSAGTDPIWWGDSGSLGSEGRSAGGESGNCSTALATIMMTRQPLRHEDIEMKAGTAKTVVERPYRIEERGGARPPLPVPAVAPPRCTASFFFWGRCASTRRRWREGMFTGDVFAG